MNLSKDETRSGSLRRSDLSRIGIDVPLEYELLSFSPLSKGEDMFRCKINILECSRCFISWDIEKITTDKTFSSYLVINRKGKKEKFPYQLCLNVKDGYETAVLNLYNYRNIVYDEDLLTIKFVNRKKRKFKIQFEHEYDFHCIRRILNIRERVKYSDMVIHGIQERPVLRHDIIRNYDSPSPNGGRTNSLCGGKVNSSTGPSIEGHLDGRLLMSVEDWELNEMYEWFKRIPCIRENEIISLFHFITLENMKSSFDLVFQRSMLCFTDLRDYVTGIKEIPDNISCLRNIILINPVIKNRLIHHFNITSHLGNRYDPTFYSLLRKKTKKIDLKSSNNRLLDQLEESIFLDDVYSWSEVAIRCKLAFNFLFGITIEQYIKQVKDEFDEYSQKFGENLSSCERIKRIKEFSNLINLDIVDLDVDFRYKYERDKLDCEFEEIKKKLEFTRDALMKDGLMIRQDIVPNKEIYKLKKERIDKHFPEIFEILNLTKEEILRKRKKRSEVLSKYKSLLEHDIKYTINTFKKDLESLQKERNSIFKKKTEFIMRENDWKRRERWKDQQQQQQQQQQHQDNNDNNESTKGLFVCLNRLIDNKLKEWIGEKKTISIHGKWISSRYIPKTKLELEKTAIELHRVYWGDTDMFRMGLTHSSILLSNLLFQFTGQEICLVENVSNLGEIMDCYDDLIAVDCQTLEFFSIDQFNLFINELCRFILDINANFEYSQWRLNPKKEKFKINCQEFAVRLLRRIDLPEKFYDCVEQYIKSLSQLTGVEVVLSKEEKEKEKEKEKEEDRKICFRYCVVPNELFELLSDKNDDDEEEEEEKEEESCVNIDILEKKKIVNFTTHKELDEFIIKMYQLCPSFDIDYPGFFQLLKSMDRSFWMMKQRTRRKEYEPLRDQNGVCKCRFPDMKLMKEEEEEEVEGESEEEEEGESESEEEED